MTERLNVTQKPRLVSEFVHGAPVGQNLAIEREEFDEEHYLMPESKKARLRAATNKALRRG